MFGWKKSEKEESVKYKLSHMDVDVTGLDIVEEYKVGKVKVYITSDSRYLVKEPPIGDSAVNLYNTIIDKINMGVELTDADNDPKVLADKLEKAFWDTAKRLERYDEATRMFPDLTYYIHREMLGYGIIDPLMKDPAIEDILCSAYDRNVRVIHKRYSGIHHSLETNIAFESITEMERFIQKVYSKTGTEPTESIPMSVTHMADGSRISATFGKQVTQPGPIIAIRKFPTEPFTITDMLKTGHLSSQMAAYIWTMLDAKAVGLVIGVTGSGKTTLLSAFVSMMNPGWRILTIEDTLELQIPHEDWVRANTRKSYGMLSEKFDIPIRSLIDMSLTQRPDYEIVGEIRLDDMDALFQSVGTGHGGLTSFHASTPGGALTRMRGNKISEGELALLWFTVHSASITRDGVDTRKVTDISEIVPDEMTGTVAVNNIFKYDIFKDKFVQNQSLEESYRYQEALQICGILDPKEDMKKRIALLEQCVSKDVSDVHKVFEILRRYYE